MAPSPDACEREPGESRASTSRCAARASWTRSSSATRGEACAVVVEPLVQCAGGHAHARPGVPASCARACDRHGVHLIADEIAVGFGRTGTLFACEQARHRAGLPVPVQGPDRRLPAAVGGAHDARPSTQRSTPSTPRSAPSCTRTATPAIRSPAAPRSPRSRSSATSRCSSAIARSRARSAAAIAAMAEHPHVARGAADRDDRARWKWCATRPRARPTTGANGAGSRSTGTGWSTACCCGRWATWCTSCRPTRDARRDRAHGRGRARGHRARDALTRPARLTSRHAQGPGLRRCAARRAARTSPCRRSRPSTSRACCGCPTAPRSPASTATAATTPRCWSRAPQGRAAVAHRRARRRSARVAAARSRWCRRIARGEKMDLDPAEGDRAGRRGIVPVVTERTEVRLDEDRAEGAPRTGSAWSRALANSAAARACRRSRRRRTLSRYAAAATPRPGSKLVLHPEAAGAMRVLPGGVRRSHARGRSGRRLLRTRPRRAALAGFRKLRLGPRILRTETAGLAALAVLQARFGDLRNA